MTSCDEQWTDFELHDCNKIPGFTSFPHHSWCQDKSSNTLYAKKHTFILFLKSNPLLGLFLYSIYTRFSLAKSRKWWDDKEKQKNKTTLPEFNSSQAVNIFWSDHGKLTPTCCGFCFCCGWDCGIGCECSGDHGTGIGYGNDCKTVIGTCVN